MQCPHARRPEHHLFWINGPAALATYAYQPGALRPPGAVNLRAVVRANPAQGEFLDAWARPLDSRIGRPAAAGMREMLRTVRDGGALSPVQLRLVALNAIRLGAFRWLAAIRDRMQAFSPALTSAYREIVARLPMPETPHHELLFHCAGPDFYLWQPASPDAMPDGPLVVCFTTRSASLNMPLALAHVLLGRMGCPVLYVLNRPGYLVSQGLKGVGEEATLALLRHVIGKAGRREAVGLGASFGGYQACVFARRLGLARVLSYSGLSASDHPGREIWRFVDGMREESMLAVFDRNDAVDRKLVEEYRANRVPTRIELLDHGRHGTFTGAFLAGRLDDHLRWLCGG